MFGGVLPILVERSDTHKLLALEGERFIEERQIVSGIVNPEETVVDVGANIRYYTLLFNQRFGPNGKIVAAEPEPKNLVELRRSIEINKLNNSTVVPFVLGEKDKDVSLGEGVNGMVSEAESDTIRVVQRKLDTLLNQLNIASKNMIKIDIEGYEWYALQGMRKVLDEARPRLFIEVHPALLPKSVKTSDLFAQLSEIYSDVKIYVSTKNASFTEKIRKRYWGFKSSEFLPKHHLPAFLAAADARKQKEPFWLVCRNVE